MQVIVEIDEAYYKFIKQEVKLLNSNSKPHNILANGIPLPKGHGRILDEKDILDTKNNDGGWYDLVDMPEYIAGVKAIIEADKTER